MIQSFFAPQIGFLPTGAAGIPQVSSVFIGRSVSGVYEGIGYGVGGRPDPLQVLQINFGDPVGDGTYVARGAVTMNVDDLVSAAAANTHFPTNLNLTLREVAICDNGTSKRAVVLMSQPYAAP